VDQVFRYKIPALHPVVVHFPVVLVLVATIFVILWAIHNRRSMLVSAVWIQMAAFAAIVGSYLSGQVMAENSEGVPIVDALVGLHEEAAWISMWMAGITLVTAIVVLVRSRRNVSSTETWIRLIVSLLALLTSLGILWTAHIGGTMVWGTLS
jgi:uncharacterized membrane protein